MYLSFGKEVAVAASLCYDLSGEDSCQRGKDSRRTSDRGKEEAEYHAGKGSVLCVKGKGSAGGAASGCGGETSAGFEADGFGAGGDGVCRDQPELFL